MFDKSCLMENMSWVEIDKAMKAGKRKRSSSVLEQLNSMDRGCLFV